MKNIKISIFYTMIIATTISRTDDIAPSSFSIKDQNGSIFEMVINEPSKQITIDWPTEPDCSVSAPSSSKIRKFLEHYCLSPQLLSVAQKIMALDNEDYFLRCLEDNSDRKISGLPKTCEEAAVAFAICFGYLALEKKIVEYNKTKELLYPKK